MGFVAGVALLTMSVLAGFANFVVLEGVVTEGDPAATAKAILGSETLFRWGVVAWVLVGALDVLVAWALMVVFTPVHSGLSTLAGWFRLAYTAVLIAAVGRLVGVPRLLGAEEVGGALANDQRHAQALLQIAAFRDIWDAGLVLFGLHLLLIGYLAYVSGYVPRLLGALLAVAGLGYLLDGLASVLYPGGFSISTVTFVGEFLLALWLVTWGRRATVSATFGEPERVRAGGPRS